MFLKFNEYFNQSYFIVYGENLFLKVTEYNPEIYFT